MGIEVSAEIGYVLRSDWVPGRLPKLYPDFGFIRIIFAMNPTKSSQVKSCESACMVEKSNSGMIHSGFMHVEIHSGIPDSYLPVQICMWKGTSRLELNKNDDDGNRT